jgi:hypothetical protein
MRHGRESDLARRLPTVWSYVDRIGSRYALMVWRRSAIVQQSGIGQYVTSSAHDTESAAVEALQAFIARVQAK